MIAPAHNGKILVVEDDLKTAALIACYLEREGYEVLRAHDGRTGLTLGLQHRPMLVVLDLMLPELDGWEVCSQLRRASDVPIIMLTARGDEIDRVSGLTLGADDYVVKPFSPRELVARVKAVLRRPRVTQERQKEIFSIGGLTLNTIKRKVQLDGETIALTPHEYALLKKLIGSPGRVFKRDELLAALYPDGSAYVIDRVVDVHIGKLRQKIEPDLGRPSYILTVRGVGYRFRDKEER